jgi:hypothetical protein
MPANGVRKTRRNPGTAMIAAISTSLIPRESSHTGKKGIATPPKTK